VTRLAGLISASIFSGEFVMKLKGEFYGTSRHTEEKLKEN
jgi:hypothetical protein